MVRSILREVKRAILLQRRQQGARTAGCEGQRWILAARRIRASFVRYVDVKTEEIFAQVNAVIWLLFCLRASSSSQLNCVVAIYTKAKATCSKANLKLSLHPSAVLCAGQRRISCLDTSQDCSQ